MTTPLSPRLAKGGLLLLDPSNGRLLRTIPLQYNPESLSRTLNVQGTEGGDGSGGRSSALRLKGPPVETLKVEAEIDATDGLGAAAKPEVEVGIQHRVAALEALVYPDSGRLAENDRLLATGVLEVAPTESPLVLFVWGPSRVVPVRVTDLSVTEEAFDVALNPIRAKVSIGLRVLSTSDLGFGHRGGTLYLAYQQGKERLAGRVAGSPADLGLEAAP